MSEGMFFQISKSLLIYFLHHSDHRIQYHCHNAQQYDRHDQPIHLKYLARVDDQIPQSVSCRQEFSDHHPYQAQPDIDLHIADDRRHGAWQYDFEQRVPAVPVECIYELDLFLVHGGEAGIQVHDAAEDRDGHSSDDDGCGRGAQPYDQQRRERGLGQAVQDYEIRFQYFGEFPAAPQEHRDKDAEQCDKQEADNGLVQCDPYVQEDRAVQHHFPETQGDPGRAAENKGINDACIGADFPQNQKENKDQHPRGAHDHAAAAQTGQELLLFV